jgi:GNAT superfamily N-acetyltransferase
MIRDYCASDFLAVAAIYDASKLDELRFETKEFTLLPLEQDAKRRTGLLASMIFIYEEQSTIKGYSAISDNTLQSLYVHPNSRGQGIGRLLLNHALAQLKGEVSLQVVESNMPSKQLYYSCGFVDAHSYDVDYNGVMVRVNKMLKHN